MKKNIYVLDTLCRSTCCLKSPFLANLSAFFSSKANDFRGLFIGMILLGAPFDLFADRDPTYCIRSLEEGFFQEGLIMTAFSFYNIPQGTWVPMYLKLKEKSLNIHQRLKKKTVNMVPNPLEYPVNTSIARKLLKESLYEVFVESLYANDVILQQNAFRITGQMVDDMFNYIFDKQNYKFIDCFGPEKL